ncbi:Marvel domain [Trinorchestia longiramus]|nr:Marvel domain [Trinorchestia longiramus]
MLNLNFGYVRSVSGILKIVEMATVLVAFLVLRLSDANTTLFIKETDGFYIGVGTMFSCLLVTPLLFIVYLMGKMEIQNTVFEFSMNFLFFFFLTVFAVIDLVYFGSSFNSGRNGGITAGFFALVAAVSYLGDSVMAIFQYRK